MTLCAADISASAPTREMVARFTPDVPWRGGPEYEADPYRALFDITPAERLIGWRPVHSWTQYMTTSSW